MNKITVIESGDLRHCISVRQKEIAEITPTRVTQGATLDNNKEQYGAANAVDKDLSTKSGAQASWLKLELGKIHQVHMIRIYYTFYTNWYDPKRDDWCTKNVGNFKACVNSHNNVDVSVYQGEVKQKSCGTLQLTYGLEQSDQIYTLICNTEGDTVKLSKTTEWISVFEVAVIRTGSYN